MTTVSKLRCVGLSLATWAYAVAATAQSVGDPRLIVDQIVTGMNLPVQMVFLGPDELLVLEQKTGKVLRVSSGAIVGEALDVAVNRNGGEHGLLGIALHPQLASTNWVYLYYSESSTGQDTSEAAEILGTGFTDMTGTAPRSAGSRGSCGPPG